MYKCINFSIESPLVAQIYSMVFFVHYIISLTDIQNISSAMHDILTLLECSLNLRNQQI